MSIFNRKKKEEIRRTVTGECAKILDEAFTAVDKTLAEEREQREAAKRLQKAAIQAGVRFQLKKA